MLQDLQLDNPDAAHLVSLFLGRAIVDEVLPPSFLAAVLPSLEDHSEGVNIVQSTGELPYPLVGLTASHLRTSILYKALVGFPRLSLVCKDANIIQSTKSVSLPMLLLGDSFQTRMPDDIPSHPMSAS